MFRSHISINAIISEFITMPLNLYETMVVDKAEIMYILKLSPL